MEYLYRHFRYVPVDILLPITRQVHSWLWTGSTEQCHLTMLRLSCFMSKAMPLPIFQIPPLSGDTEEFPISILTETECPFIDER
jgi:hypothetical protein